ncbi:MAG: hypothetical protein AB8G99_19740, partial [Planctomycetaceae bacterium]
MPPESIADIIVQTLSRGGWSEDAIVRRMRRALRPHLQNTKWFRSFAQRLVESETPSRDLRDNLDEFARYVLGDPDFEREVGSAVYIDYELDVEKIVRPEMSPEAWGVPALTNSNELADWFGLSISHLDWLADCRGLERFARKEKWRNYRYRWIAKHAGGRLLVVPPKPRLKVVQRQILV